jgi:hypothetical protein
MEMKFHLNENIYWYCMQFELKFNSNTLNGTQIHLKPT